MINKINSFADKLGVRSEEYVPGEPEPNYGYEQQPVDPRYAAYGNQPPQYAPQQQQPQQQQYYQPAPEPVDETVYEPTYGNYGYTAAGVRPKPQSRQKGKSGLSGLLNKIMPPAQPQYDPQPPPDNVIPMSAYDPAQGGYADQGYYGAEPQGYQEPYGSYAQQQQQPTNQHYSTQNPAPQTQGYDYDEGYDPRQSAQSTATHTTRQGQGRQIAATMIYLVRQLEDAEEIIAHMLDGGNVIVNMEDIDEVLKQRLLDMISGASFALDCSVKRISYRNYFIAPSGEEIVSNMGVRDRERETEDGGIRGGFRGRESRVKEYDRSRERSQGRDRDRDLDRDRDRDWDRGRY